MKKIITLMLLLTGMVGITDAEDVTVRIIAVDNNSYASNSGETPFIHIYKTDNTVLTGSWDTAPAMTHYKYVDGKNWFYYDLTTDKSNLSSVKWIFRNYSKNAQTGDMQDGKDLTSKEYYCWINSGNNNNVFEAKYYLYNITKDTYTEMTNTYGVLTGDIDAGSITGNENTYENFLIVPEYAKNNLGNGAWGWNFVFRPQGSGDYEVSSFTDYNATGYTGDGSQNWKVSKIDEATFDINYNVRTNVYSFKPYIERTLNAAAEGYATFSYSASVIPESGLTAKYASAVNNGKITWTDYPATGILAGQGALLKGTAGEPYKFTPATSAVAPSTNLLKAISVQGIVSGTTGSGADKKTNYILTNKYVSGGNTVTGSVGFYKANSSGSLCAAGTAYLEVSTPEGNNPAREFYTVWDETTSVESIVKDVENTNLPVYDLQGRRVNNPQKGLYIVNGKKVIK